MMIMRIYTQDPWGGNQTSLSVFKSTNPLLDAIRLEVFKTNDQGKPFSVYALTTQDTGKLLKQFRSMGAAQEWIGKMTYSNYGCGGQDVEDTITRVIKHHYKGNDGASLIKAIGEAPGTAIDALKNMRKRLRLTQKELADKLGVTQNYISMVENGSREPNSIVRKYISKH